MSSEAGHCEQKYGTHPRKSSDPYADATLRQQCAEYLRLSEQVVTLARHLAQAVHCQVIADEAPVIAYHYGWMAPASGGYPPQWSLELDYKIATAVRDARASTTDCQYFYDHHDEVLQLRREYNAALGH